MGEHLARYVRLTKKAQEAKDRHQRPKAKNGGLPPMEQRAFEKIKREAAENGVTLANGGKGGLPPSLALGVFRRDKWRCQVEGCEAPTKDLDLDHIAGHAKEIKEDPEARKDPALKRGVAIGKRNVMDALHVVCARHHDLVHDRERAIEDGKKPPPMPEGND